MYNRFREENEHLISINIGQDYRSDICAKMSEITDIIIAHPEAYNAFVKEDQMWEGLR